MLSLYFEFLLSLSVFYSILTPMPRIMPVQQQFQEHGDNVANQSQYPQIKYYAHQDAIKDVRYVRCQAQDYDQELYDISQGEIQRIGQNLAIFTQD